MYVHTHNVCIQLTEHSYKKTGQLGLPQKGQKQVYDLKCKTYMYTLSSFCHIIAQSELKCTVEPLLTDTPELWTSTYNRHVLKFQLHFHCRNNKKFPEQLPHCYIVQ